MENQEQRYGRYADIARIYGISKNTLYTLVHRGLIPCHRVSKRLVLFSYSEIEIWIKSGASKKQSEVSTANNK